MTLTDEMKAVIAEFMGYSKTNLSNPFHEEASCYMNIYGDCIYIDSVPYDTDWNWAMDVYRKVKRIWENNRETFWGEDGKWPIECYESGNLFAICLVALTKAEDPTPLPLSIALYNLIVFFKKNGIKGE